jgi:hypothetical protein
VSYLGDDLSAQEWTPEPFEPPKGAPSRQGRRSAHAKHEYGQARDQLEYFQAAARANRQLATELHAQGVNEEADRFTYRAQVLQWQVFRLQKKALEANRLMVP